MFLPIIIKYALKKYGIDLEKLLKKYPFLKIDSKPEEEIKDTSFVDDVVEKMNTGLFLKSQLGLLDLPYVYIRRMLRSSIFYYEVIFDTYLKRSIPYSVIKNLTFHKAFIFRGDNLNRKIFSPPIPIESFNGKIPSNAIIIKLDIAGKYYSKLKEDYKVFKKDKELLKEITLQDFASADGYSDHNELWLKKRKNNGNTKINFSKVTYNSKTGALRIFLNIVPSYINKPSEYKDGKVEGEVEVLKIDGTIIKGKRYTCQFYFEDIKSFIKSRQDWENLTKRDRIEIVRELIKNYDKIKYFISTPSFLFHGIWDKLEQLDSVIYPFPAGIPRRGTKTGFHWDTDVHKSDIYTVKHLRPCYEVALFNADKIAQAITNEFEKRGEI